MWRCAFNTQHLFYQHPVTHSCQKQKPHLKSLGSSTTALASICDSCDDHDGFGRQGGAVGPKQVNPAMHHCFLSWGSSLLQLPLLYRPPPLPFLDPHSFTIRRTSTLKPANSWWRKHLHWLLTVGRRTAGNNHTCTQRIQLDFDGKMMNIGG